MEEFTCCLCGERHEGYGNNPAPVKTGAKDRCCDHCNSTVILPARFRKLGYITDEAETVAEEIRPRKATQCE